MKNNLYFLERYVKCGAMPLYLVFYRDSRGRKGHCAMLCTVRKLRGLLQQRKGFASPESYGRIIYKGFDDEPSELLKQIIKARYDFDLDHAASMENRLM
jgi:hypothetical protein